MYGWMDACMYVYVRMYICMYVFVCMYVCVCMYVFIYFNRSTLCDNVEVRA
jgi:hypothetical protein